ncbi:hypothetical protein BGW38_002763 [Lunasporangiospora selenospora]|uniref:pyridoxal kinase n=1 Tax=Lunasporangiospora selenospora TaxID=979761 RepID=A0A9P6G4I5_9FUNG|nr:hypothetical protein BGW38_002763 [Lunasporangiospora selenospora]
MVSGYCGNKAATFPLQLLGFDVDVMNSVNLSNHTGYPSWTGEVATGEQLTKLFEGLETNGLSEYTHLLTGYIGSAQKLAAVSKIVKKLHCQSDVFFVMDPVMGDNGELYVQPDVIPLYREMMKYAKAITPNQFEAETLADKKITNVKTCLEVIDALHAAGAKNVVITSVSLSRSDIAANLASRGLGFEDRVPEEPLPLTRPSLSEESVQSFSEDDISMYCVCSNGENVFAIAFPTYDGYFTGTGDLFSALLVARLEESLRKGEVDASVTNGSVHCVPPKELVQACLKVVATMKAVVLRTFQAQEGVGGRSIDRAIQSSSAVVKRCELRLIQSKHDIEYPDVNGFIAVELRRK